eukprot:scaffold6057_cov66-Attheya_sp.AAC.5
MGNIIARLSTCISDCVVYNRVDLSKEGQRLFNKVDEFTRILVATVPPDIISDKENAKDTYLVSSMVDLGWKRTGSGFTDWKPERVKETVIRIPEDVKIPILTEDDVFGEVNGFIFDVLTSHRLFPLKDTTFVATDEEAKMLRAELLLAPTPEQACPVPYTVWDELSSDEAMSRLFFYGLGSVLMFNQSAVDHSKYADLGPFVVDINLSDLPVRAGFRRYGFRAHFNADQAITAIFDYVTDKLVKPGDGDAWEIAKYIMKTTVMTVVTAREHLMWAHMLVSNTLARVKTRLLPPSHPIRRLLTVFTFRTNYINNAAAESLLPKLGIVNRSTAFTFDSLLKVFESSYKGCNIFQPFTEQSIGPDLKKMSDDGKFPMYADGVAYFNVVHEFVREWMETAGDSVYDDDADNFFQQMKEATKGQAYEIPLCETDEERINVLSQLIFVVTAYHELVGTVIDYFQLPSFMGLRALRDGSTTTDLQAYLNGMALAAFTAVRMPDLMRSFPNFFGKDGAPEWEVTVWSNFQENLKIRSEQVKEANKTRKYPFKTFDPVQLECAVSV